MMKNISRGTYVTKCAKDACIQRVFAKKEAIQQAVGVLYTMRSEKSIIIGHLLQTAILMR